MSKEKELELIDRLYMDCRGIALSTDPLLQEINKLKTPSLSLELQIRIKRVQIELLTTLELLSDLQNCNDETEFEKILDNYLDKG